VGDGPSQGGVMEVPYFVDADNVQFELGGGPRKVGGTSKLFSSALSVAGVTAIRGLFDYWRMGTTGTSVQKRILHVGTTIKKDDADGTFANLFTGLSATSIPAYCVFGDAVIISQTGADVPKWWDQTTAQNLAGSPPNFAFAVAHKNRVWAAGVDSTPSTLYYSVFTDEEDWTGAGSGTIAIDPDDGDRITGLVSHKNDLWVFKGSQNGSIHRITGSAPTGDDAFSRIPFVDGVGAVNHNGIFRFRNDIGFVGPQGIIHSLAATAAFGDFLVSSLSFPLNDWLRAHVNNSVLNQCWAATDEIRGCVRITLPIDSGTTPNYMLCMDYRRSTQGGAPDIWWSSEPAFTWPTVARVLDPDFSNVPTLMAGGDDGFVRRMDRQERSIDGVTAISASANTPYFSYGSGLHKKMIYVLTVSLVPKGAFDMTIGWKRDDKAEQTQTITQGSGGDVLGGTAPHPANVFTLDASALGGGLVTHRSAELEEGGEFAAIQYRFRQGKNLEDMEIQEFSSLLASGVISVEDV
jgi:hypothetical protein